MIGLLFGVWAALRIRSGRSYISDPPTRVDRRDDPFSFWLSVMPLILIALTLVGGALGHFLFN